MFSPKVKMNVNVISGAQDVGGMTSHFSEKIAKGQKRNASYQYTRHQTILVSTVGKVDSFLNESELTKASTLREKNWMLEESDRKNALSSMTDNNPPVIDPPFPSLSVAPRMKLPQSKPSEPPYVPPALRASNHMVIPSAISKSPLPLVSKGVYQQAAPVAALPAAKSRPPKGRTPKNTSSAKIHDVSTPKKFSLSTKNPFSVLGEHS